MLDTFLEVIEVGDTPRYLEVMGSDPAVCWAFCLFSLVCSLGCVALLIFDVRCLAGHVELGAN